MANKLRNSERVPFDFEDGLMIKGKNIESDAGAELIGHKSALLPSRKLDQILDDIQPITQSLSIYISPTGSDTTGDGTSSNPWYSPHRALEWLSTRSIKAEISATIWAAPGEYNFNKTLAIETLPNVRIAIVGSNLLKPIPYEIDGPDKWHADGDGVAFTDAGWEAAKVLNQAKARTIWPTVFTFTNCRVANVWFRSRFQNIAFIGINDGVFQTAIQMYINRLDITHCFFSNFLNTFSTIGNGWIYGSKIVACDVTNHNLNVSYSNIFIESDIVLANGKMSALTITGGFVSIGESLLGSFKVIGFRSNGCNAEQSVARLRYSIWKNIGATAIRSWGGSSVMAGLCKIYNALWAFASENTSYISAHEATVDNVRKLISVTLGSSATIAATVATNVTENLPIQVGYNSVIFAQGVNISAYNALGNWTIIASLDHNSYGDFHNIVFNTGNTGPTFEANRGSQMRILNINDVTYRPAFGTIGNLNSLITS